ncbi:hypothetical protein PPYR_10665 [Photinus pyralis]|uniref:Alpha-and gamma-adaptin-binding protein p34 n=1 Tax=Photinus pyralis TaxID=7054 RepID=A0A1Y1K579_PHOPY|nr:alpha- and gamma-adaptin-binding protein p34-like [Photinus pyralis]KAB0796604.1 hypothetical protein PPYR_10665 [Photinus pyralis]
MESKYSLPIILIVSSSSTKPKSVIKLLTGATVVTETENEVSCTWQIDTKYYTADVDIYGITDTYDRTSEFNNNVDALIIHMDSNKDTGLEDLVKWQSLENDCDPEIKLLICNYCNAETKVKKANAIDWCLKHGYELIELYPNVVRCEETEEDEIIKEKVGVDRIIEALQAHVWPSLVLKSKHENVSRRNEDIEESSSVNSNQLKEGGFLTNEATDDFTELFSQLHMIQQSMKSLPISQRKQCAEQMVTAFWHAIGGDEEEISDI